MIPNDRDRFECLKLAVTLMIPRSNGAGSSTTLVASVLAAADQFYGYVTQPDAEPKKP
jgi:mevalonate kinase